MVVPVKQQQSVLVRQRGRNPQRNNETMQHPQTWEES